MEKHIRAKYFEVDQLGIDDLKDRCFNEAKEFSYFRKGEWAGIVASIDNAGVFQTAWPEIVMTAVVVYPGAKELAKDAARLVGAGATQLRTFISGFVGPSRRKNHICRRVICSRRVSKARIAEWEEICGSGGVVTIPKSQVAPFAYVVSDRMWAIFTRFGKNDLRGMRGRDQHTITMLRNRFDLEFSAAKMKRAK